MPMVFLRRAPRTAYWLPEVKIDTRSASTAPTARGRSALRPLVRSTGSPKVNSNWSPALLAPAVSMLTLDKELATAPPLGATALRMGWAETEGAGEGALIGAADSFII